MSKNNTETKHLPRWPRPVVLGVGLAVVIAVGIGGLWLGSTQRSQTDAQIRAANRPVVTTAKVTYKTQELSSATGTVGEAASFSYTPPARSDGQPLVVTSVGPSVGSDLRAGQLLVSIDDDPTFGLPLTITPWRDLGIGDVGSDVLSLNDALSNLGLFYTRPTNTYSAETARAVERLYTAAGYSAHVAPATNDADGTTGVATGSGDASTSGTNSASSPTTATKPQITYVAGDSLPLGAIARIPVTTLKVTQIASVGAALSTSAPALAAQGAANTVTTKVDILHRQQIRVGQFVTLQAPGGGGSSQGKISAIGSFSAGDPTKDGIAALNGYLLTVSYTPVGSAGTLAPGDQVQIGFTAAPDRELAVPTMAIRQSSSSPTVLVRSKSGYHSVTVDPLWQQGGWTGVKTSSHLAAGDLVVTSGRS